MRCPHCHKIIYPKSQRPAPSPPKNSQLPAIYELRYMAKQTKPIFQAVVRDGFQEGDEDLREFLSRGWIAQKDDGFVVTQAGRNELKQQGLL